MSEMIAFYEAQSNDLQVGSHAGAQRTAEAVEKFIDRDPRRISWTRA